MVHPTDRQQQVTRPVDISYLLNLFIITLVLVTFIAEIVPILVKKIVRGLEFLALAFIMTFSIYGIIKYMA